MSQKSRSTTQNSSQNGLILDPIVQEQVSLLENLGLKSAHRPAGELPSLPDDLTAISLTRLGADHARFVAWLQYANHVVAIADAHVNVYKMKLKAAHGKIAMSKKEGDEEVYFTAEELEQKYEIAKVFKGIAEETRRSIKDAKELLSREQSRRRDEGGR